MLRVLMRSGAPLSARPYIGAAVTRCFKSASHPSLVCRATTEDDMVDAKQYHSRWEGMWVAGLDHGEAFDANRAAPVLVQLLESEEGQALCKGKRAVVPGCGRGYDLVAFAKYGAAKVVGVEISESASGPRALLYRGQVSTRPVILVPEPHLQVQPYVIAKVATDYVSRQPEAAGVDVTVEVQDWLSTGEAASTDAAFDVGYDYTFFCALHPDMRRAWAEGWARRLRSGGTLIALAFPIEDSDREGPPWPLQLADYEAVLGPCGFTCVKQEPVPQAMATVDKRAGREILTQWVKA